MNEAWEENQKKKEEEEIQHVEKKQRDGKFLRTSFS